MATSKFRLETDGRNVILNPVFEKESANLPIIVNIDEHTTKVCTDYYKHFNDFFDRLNASIQSLNTTEKNVSEVFCAFEELIENYNSLILSMLPQSNVIDTAKQFVIDKIKSRNTAKKRQKIIASDESYVKPTKSAIGLTWKSQSLIGNDLPCHQLEQTTYEFISIIETLRSLFNSDQYYKDYIDFNENRKHVCEEGVYQDFCCGSIYRANNDINSTTIQLQLGIDDFEPCCAIKTKAGVHKTCGVYFEIRNIDPKQKSKLRNDHLIAFAKSHDIKSEGFGKIARKIVDELKLLENVGITLKSGASLKAILVNISCDNLGANGVLGFVESFSATYYCRICELPLSECQKTVYEIEEKMRTKSDYALTLEYLAENKDRKPNYKESKGVKTPCFFNELQHYHMFDNCTVDIMHDLNEGAIPFFMRLLFQHIVQEKIASIGDLQAICRDYTYYGWIWKKYKPSKLIIEKDNLNQNAMQSHCLMLNLPFILIDFRSELGHWWNAMEVFLQILQILYSTRILERDVNRLRALIQQHLSFLSGLGSNLLPKHHMMTHYPNLILKIGPLIHSWMMRFESKHKEFTDMVRLTSNYRNIPFALAKRHQDRVCVTKCMAFKTKIDASKTTYDISKCDGFEMFESLLLQFTDNLLPRGIKFVRDGSLECRPGLMLINSNQIHKIIHIFSLRGKYFILCKKLSLIGFAFHFNSIQIAENEDSFEIFDMLDIKCQKSHDSVHFEEKKYIIADTLEVFNDFI